MKTIPIVTFAAFCLWAAPAAAQTEPRSDHPPHVPLPQTQQQPGETPSSPPGANPRAWGVAAPPGKRNVIVDTLINRQLHDGQGQPLGRVKGVALNLSEDRFYLVVTPQETTGSRASAGKDVAIPLPDTAIRNGQLTVAKLDAAQLAQLPAWTGEQSQWRMLVGATVVPITD